MVEFKTMETELKDLSDSGTALKEMVLQQATRIVLNKEKQQHYFGTKQQLEKENQHYKTQTLSLQEQPGLLRHKHFGGNSEKLSQARLKPFNEAGRETDVLEQANKDRNETLVVSARQRKKPGRKPLPENLSHEEIINDLTDAEKDCLHDGQTLKTIGEERTVKNSSPEVRQKQTKAIPEEMKRWPDASFEQVPSQPATGETIHTLYRECSGAGPLEGIEVLRPDNIDKEKMKSSLN